MKKSARVSLPILVASALAAAALVAPLAEAKPAGPKISNCSKLKRSAKSKCQTVNQANTVAFNQIKDSMFVGVRGDGEEVEETYCANGKFESRSTGYYGTGVSTGSHWTIRYAVVKQGGKWINAFVSGPDGFEIALMRRGQSWKIGVALSFNSIESPGPVEKTNAAAACKTL